MSWFLAQAAPSQPNIPWYANPMIFFMVFIFAFYYIFVLSPMKKKQRAFQDMMSKLKNGDHVVTTSGMHGVVTGLTDKTVKIRIANNVVVEMDKSAIASLATAEEAAKEEKK